MAMGTLASARLNLGCGPGPQATGWVHVDGSWNARMSKFGFVRRGLAAFRIVPSETASLDWIPGVVTTDLRRPLPFGSGLFECVYASHVLEHLHDEEARRLLLECHRVLRPEGIIRLVVPDLLGMVQRYLGTASPREQMPGGQLPADRLNEDLHMRSRSAARGSLLFRAYSAMTEFHWHKWMYDAESLIARVQRAGFSEVEQRRFVDSRIQNIHEIERADRVVDGAGICVEGVKPAR